MRRSIVLAALAALALGGAQAAAQSHTFDFEDGTDQGFGTGFGNDASATFTIDNIGGSLRMRVPNSNSFQDAGREVGNNGSTFFNAMAAAAENEAGYVLSYDWYVDTSLSQPPGTFLQLGTFVNTGNGYYAQDFPGAGKDVELDGTALASGQVFSGTVSETFTAKGFDMPSAQTFFRIGFIINGTTDAGTIVHFDNITIAPVPEPASLALLAFAVPALAIRRRRHA
jgi:hypothetical protein